MILYIYTACGLDISLPFHSISERLNFFDHVYSTLLEICLVDSYFVYVVRCFAARFE